MPKETNAKIEIPASLLTIYQDMAVSPVDLLKNHALNVIREKIIRYSDEDRGSREKHGFDFEHFRTRIDGMMDEENFEWEDDLMGWEFAGISVKILNLY